MVAVMAVEPVFMAVNDRILPVPLVGRPIEGLVFTQL
jgi:hypothetical protein